LFPKSAGNTYGLWWANFYFVLIFCILEGTHPIKRFLESEFMVLLGDLSYPIYLFHFSMKQILFKDRISVTGNQHIAIPLVFTLAYILHNLVEKQFVNFSRKIFESNSSRCRISFFDHNNQQSKTYDQE